MKASRLVLIGVAAGGALAVGAVVLHRRRLARSGGSSPERVEPTRPPQPVLEAPVVQQEAASAHRPTPAPAPAPEVGLRPVSPARTPAGTRSKKIRRASAIVLTGGVVAAAAVSGVMAFSDSGADSATDPIASPQSVNVAAAQPVIRTVTAQAKPGTRTAVAMCPSGFRVVSGGGFVNGTNGGSALSAAVPFHGSAGDGFTTVWGGPQNGGDESAVATCAKGLSGIQIVSKAGPRSGGTQAKAQAWVPCPVGTRVVGFGGKVSPVARSVLSGLGPVKHGKGGYVQASGASRLTAYAVCAKAPAKWQVRTWTSASTATPTKDYKLLCPADTRRLGGGFTTFQQRTRLVNAFGAGAPEGITGARTAPKPGIGGGPWRLRVTAVCAR